MGKQITRRRLFGLVGAVVAIGAVAPSVNAETASPLVVVTPDQMPPLYLDAVYPQGTMPLAPVSITANHATTAIESNALYADRFAADTFTVADVERVIATDSIANSKIAPKTGEVSITISADTSEAEAVLAQLEARAARLNEQILLMARADPLDDPEVAAIVAGTRHNAVEQGWV